MKLERDNEDIEKEEKKMWKKQKKGTKCNRASKIIFASQTNDAFWYMFQSIFKPHKI